MFHSPLIDFYFKHQKWINDFFAQMLILLVVYFIDSTLANISKKNMPFISLPIFFFCYLAARDIVRKLKKQKHFGGWANYGVYYNAFLSIGAWIPYMIFIRIPKFH